MNHWLLKSEPSTYSWQDLVKDGSTKWDGVRNNQAALNLKAMKKGDRAFFYHSGDERSVVGICEISREAYPDPSDEAGRFVMVNVKALQATKRPVSLSDIKAEARLSDIGLLRQSRLSVVPISQAHWRVICEMAGVKV